jgi:hypothetical protein
MLEIAPASHECERFQSPSRVMVKTPTSCPSRVNVARIRPCLQYGQLDLRGVAALPCC